MSKPPKNAMEISLELRLSDQDLKGSINEAQIMTLAEEARIRAMYQLKRLMDDEESLGSVMRTCNIDFHRQVMDPDNVTAKVWISHIGKTSYIVQHDLNQNGQSLATMEAVMVLYSTERQAPTTISGDLRAAFKTISSN